MYIYEVYDQPTINEAFVALFVWESIIVLDREAILFWKTPLTGPSLLYLANKYTFLALSAHTSLSQCQARWNDLMSTRAARPQNELKDGLHSIRAACLRSFPEFLADIRAAALGKTGELSTGLADFTVSVSVLPKLV